MERHPETEIELCAQRSQDTAPSSGIVVSTTAYLGILRRLFSQTLFFLRRGDTSDIWRAEAAQSLSCP